jgi:ferredoxin
MCAECIKCSRCLSAHPQDILGMRTRFWIRIVPEQRNAVHVLRVRLEPNRCPCVSSGRGYVLLPHQNLDIVE